MHRLSQHFSEPLLTLSDPSIPSLPSPDVKAEEDGSGEPSPTTTYHLFPPPHALPAKLETILRELGFGYRAGFIESSLATLRAEFGAEPGDIEKGLETFRTTEVDVVRDKLLALKGVGRKVADCVMLMCLDQASGIVPLKTSIHLPPDACSRARCSSLLTPVKPSLIPVDTHVAAIAARHPSFPSRLRHKPMSKQVYDEVQSFLLDRWGPMGGWCQAVMFAADLPSTTVNRTPRALIKTKIESKVKVEMETEVVGMTGMSGMAGMTGSPGTPASTALMTPREDRAGWIEESPLKGRGGGGSKGKRKAERVEELLCVKQEADELPAAFGFKRTRSAARIELKRGASGVSSIAGEVEELEV
jgi:N-glycosylase/DNA lyase